MRKPTRQEWDDKEYEDDLRDRRPVVMDLVPDTGDHGTPSDQVHEPEADHPVLHRWEDRDAHQSHEREVHKFGGAEAPRVRRSLVKPIRGERQPDRGEALVPRSKGRDQTTEREQRVRFEPFFRAQIHIDDRFDQSGYDEAAPIDCDAMNPPHAPPHDLRSTVWWQVFDRLREHRIGATQVPSIEESRVEKRSTKQHADPKRWFPIFRGLDEVRQRENDRRRFDSCTHIYQLRKVVRVRPQERTKQRHHKAVVAPKIQTRRSQYEIEHNLEQHETSMRVQRRTEECHVREIDTQQQRRHFPPIGSFRRRHSVIL